MRIPLFGRHIMHMAIIAIISSLFKCGKSIKLVPQHLRKYLLLAMSVHVNVLTSNTFKSANYHILLQDKPNKHNLLLKQIIL